MFSHNGPIMTDKCFGDSEPRHFGNEPGDSAGAAKEMVSAGQASRASPGPSPAAALSATASEQVGSLPGVSPWYL